MGAAASKPTSPLSVVTTPAAADNGDVRRKQGYETALLTPEAYDPQWHTVFDMFLRGARVSGNQPCFGESCDRQHASG
jgi:hypothetical protein